MLRRISFILIGIVLLASFAVPYVFLHSVGTWKGSFLFWVVAGLLIILLNVTATTGFSGDDE